MDSRLSTPSRINKASVPGMNEPTRLRQYGRYDYIPPNGDEYKEDEDEDCTFETTMIDNVQDVTLVSDIIFIKNGKEFIHYDVDRNKLGQQRWQGRVEQIMHPFFNWLYARFNALTSEHLETCVPNVWKPVWSCIAQAHQWLTISSSNIGKNDNDEMICLFYLICYDFIPTPTPFS